MGLLPLAFIGQGLVFVGMAEPLLHFLDAGACFKQERSVRMPQAVNVDRMEAVLLNDRIKLVIGIHQPQRRSIDPVEVQ